MERHTTGGQRRLALSGMAMHGCSHLLQRSRLAQHPRQQYQLGLSHSPLQRRNLPLELHHELKDRVRVPRKLFVPKIGIDC
jgi:hypothetical protein